MSVLHEYHVVPTLPEPLSPLRALAYNLHWAWDLDIIDAFRRIDRDLWKTSRHNPVLLLGNVGQERLDQLARDESYVAYLDRVYRQHLEVLEQPSWYDRARAGKPRACVAYFSAEFGLTECLPIYSGGLGVLSGDHLKSASELGLPLVGVGLIYQQGYFQQYLNADGWQQQSYPQNDFYNMPMLLERGADGAPLVITVQYPQRTVAAQIWRVQVGRVPLYLLDTNISANHADDQDITDQLYGGDRDLRIRQEIMLGIGGLRALKALGLKPTVCHMNEGHSAFQCLERIRQTMEEHKLDFTAAREACIAGNVFTTHTAVPAGFDLFPKDLMTTYFGEYVKGLGISLESLFKIGRTNPANTDEFFNMAALAIRNSTFVNGVSKLHGQVSRDMVHTSMPQVPAHEIPVTSITNGVHTRTWISREMTDLFNRYLGERWVKDPADQTVWNRVDQIPDEELWRAHERRRERLVSMARDRLREQLLRRGATTSMAAMAEEVLNPSALTIGFARRFATYKRATLLLRDLERLKQILRDTDRPVQFLFAGKAHPHDDAGKELIRRIVHTARDEDLRRRVVFLEQYDMALARYLVQGVDVWLNTPRRPLEASGTSGMKVIFNGGLNVSILDGWWAEGCSHDTGWAIGRGEEYTDQEYQDKVESEALYDLLEQAVIPTFYDRGRDGLPRQWIRMMKTSIRELGPVFNTNRMVQEYTERFYLPSDQRYREFTADGAARARSLSDCKALFHRHWREVKVLSAETETQSDVKVGSTFAVHAKIRLGQLKPDHVRVQIYDGDMDAELKIPRGDSLPMTWVRQIEDNTHLYEGKVPCKKSGRRAFTLRILPYHPDLLEPLALGLVTWE
ncbi:MAG: alpha-glucan family phosphorylase [Deltaproteobacteria bacterium]|nr:alpha-glucan family phosphorylase [Deltaproteobacteria bacterium]